MRINEKPLTVQTIKDEVQKSPQPNSSHLSQVSQTQPARAHVDSSPKKVKSLDELKKDGGLNETSGNKQSLKSLLKNKISDAFNSLIGRHTALKTTDSGGKPDYRELSRLAVEAQKSGVVERDRQAHDEADYNFQKLLRKHYYVESEPTKLSYTEEMAVVGEAHTTLELSEKLGEPELKPLSSNDQSTAQDKSKVKILDGKKEIDPPPQKTVLDSLEFERACDELFASTKPARDKLREFCDLLKENSTPTEIPSGRGADLRDELVTHPLCEVQAQPTEVEPESIVHQLTEAIKAIEEYTKVETVSISSMPVHDALRTPTQ